jgi:hypothetical protein
MVRNPTLAPRPIGARGDCHTQAVPRPGRRGIGFDRLPTACGGRTGTARTRTARDAFAGSRLALSLDRGWRFHLGDIPFPVITGHDASYSNAKAGKAWGAAAPDYDDSDWRERLVVRGRRHVSPHLAGQVRPGPGLAAGLNGQVTVEQIP